jgi:hypothetical protein
MTNHPNRGSLYTIYYEDGSVFGVYPARAVAIRHYFSRKIRKLTPPCTLAGRPVKIRTGGKYGEPQIYVDHDCLRVRGGRSRWDKDMTLKQIEAEKAKIRAWELHHLEPQRIRYAQSKTCNEVKS